MLIIKNATIHNAVTQTPFVSDILIENGKIIRIEKDIKTPDSEVYDADGFDVYPGFIDVHTHIGMFGFSGDVSKDDVEKHDKCTPNNRGIDCVNPD